MASSRFSIKAVFKAIDRMTVPLNRMTGSSKKFSRQLKTDFIKAQRKVENFGRSIKKNLGRAFRVGIVTGLAALSFGLATAGREFIQFDKAIVSATAKFTDIDVATSQGTATLELMRLTARKVGSETQFSSTQAASGLQFLAQAGFTSSQAVALLPGIVDLATIANVDLARSTDIASDALGAFGLMSKDTTQLQTNLNRVMDVMAKTITSTNTDMEMLFETMKFAGPAFTSAGQDIETFAAIAGRMAANGIKASVAGTSMRKMMVRLQKPTAEVHQGLALFGTSASKIVKDGKLMNMIDIMAIFEKGAKKLTVVERNRALAMVTGISAFSGWAAVMNEGTEQTRLLKKQLDASKGAATKMANFMRGSLSVRIDILKSSLIELGFKFIEAFEKQGGDALASITKAVQEFDVKPIVEGVKAIILVFSFFAPVIKAIGPFILSAVVAWKIYSSVLIIVATQQLVLNAAMKANVIGIIVTAIAFLIAGFIKLVAMTGSVVGAFKVIGKVIMEAILTPINFVLTSIKNLFFMLSKIPGIGEKIKPAFAAIAGFQEKINKPFELTELRKTTDEGLLKRPETDPTGAGLLTRPTNNTTQASKSEVIIRNESRNDVDSKGRTIGPGSFLELPASGGA